jgi:hypothetical protein
MTKLKWILRDCNIYIALLFIAVSFCPSIASYQPLILCFSLIHIFKIIKMLKDKVFLISDFNLILALTCFIPLVIDFHINAYTFSLFLIIPVSLKTLLFTKISKLTLKHYLNQNNLEPDFAVIVQNDLKDYLFSGRQSTISHYFYLDNIEFRLTDNFKGVFFSKKLIPFTHINGYCTQNGIGYCDLKQDDMYRMSMLIS